MGFSDKEEDNSTKKVDTQEIQFIVGREGEKEAEEDIKKKHPEILIPEVN